MCARHNLSDFGDMELETFKRVVDQLRGVETLIAFGLGEPLLNPALPEMIEYAHAHGVPEITFTTNGIALKGELLERVATLPVTEISCSIHSPDPEIHRQIVPGADVEKIVPNVRWLKENSDIKIKINSVMMKLNYESVFDMPKLVAENGFDRWDFYMVRGITDFSKEQELPRTQEFATEIYSRMKKICEENGVNIVEAYPSTFWNKCYAPFFDAYVNYKVELAPCCTLPQIGLEKIDSFRKSWNGKPMRKWRKALMNNKPPHPYCQEVCLKYLQ
jgi:MoaA/NifB/PqqE/SkfB family radical SAM enzyme